MGHHILDREWLHTLRSFELCKIRRTPFQGIIINIGIIHRIWDLVLLLIHIVGESTMVKCQIRIRIYGLLGKKRNAPRF